MSLRRLINAIHSGDDNLPQKLESRWEIYRQKASEQERITRPHDPGRYHPSSIGGCPRAIIYTQTGQAPSNPHSSQLLRIFDMGTGVHTRLQKQFLEAGIFTAVEVKFTDPEYGITGSADGVGSLSNTEFIGEIKSMNSRNFTMLSEPTESHVKQLMCYMYGLKIHKGVFIYEAKDHSAWKMFQVEFDKKAMAEIFEFIDLINAQYLKKQLPKRPYEKSSKQCTQCSYKTACWSDSLDVQFPAVKLVGHKLEVVKENKKPWMLKSRGGKVMKK